MHKNQQLTKVQILAEEYLKEIGFLNIPSENYPHLVAGATPLSRRERGWG